MRGQPLIIVAFCIPALTVLAQTPVVTGVINIYSTVEGTVAPGMVVGVEGTNLSSSNVTACGTIAGGSPTTCGGVSVTFAGKAAAMASLTATEVVVVVPVDLTGSSAAVVLTTVQVQPTSPALAPSPNTNTPFGNFLDRFNNQISPANPALPGDTVHIQGNGFGVTNPVVPTGSPVPQSPLPVISAQVQMSVNNVDASIVSATLSPNTANPFDEVTFVVPQVGAGTQPVRVTVGGVQSLMEGLVVGSETMRVTSVVNSASNAVSGLPNAGVAPGSIIVVYGVALGPLSLVVAPPSYPWPSNLKGTSVVVTVGAQSFTVLLYYASSTQIAGLLPSGVPPGTANLIVSYNGQIANSYPITVVANNFGTYTVAQNGAGAGIVTFSDYSSVSPAKAANPGETLTIWGTGLGAVSGNEAAGPLPGDMPNIPVQVWVGGVSAQVLYRGRSGCCVGEDQIVFVVPSGPSLSGCNVPLAVQINKGISNYSTIAIAPSGRTCTPAVSLFPQGSSSPPPPRTAYVSLTRTLWPQPPAAGAEPNTDDGSGTFGVLSQTLSQFDLANEGPSLGSCMVYVGNPPSVSLPVVTGLDAGPSLSIAGPGGVRALSQGTKGVYGGHLGDASAGNFLDPGSYQLTGVGGADVGPIAASFTIPQFAWTNQPSSLFPRVAYNRASGLTVTWSGGDPNGYVQVIGTIFTTTGALEPSFVCQAHSTDGSLTIPPSVMLALPSGSADLAVAQITAAAPFFPTGLDSAAVFFEWISTAYVAFQ
jgi:uncharacterized protein (TIGR03437 family)